MTAFLRQSVIQNKPAIEKSWDEMVHQADPDYERKKRKEIEFEFTKHTFTADRSQRFPYGDE